jgi:hypothetical protein
VEGLVLTAAISVAFVVLLLLWRVWPVLMGRARPKDARRDRLIKWNMYLVGLLRKNLKSELLVARAGLFTSREDAQEHSIATWSMEPTLIPDVEYIALARPGTGDQDRPEVRAVAEASTLREILAEGVHEHNMWGHRAYLYAWPQRTDLEAVVRRLTPVDAFRARHGIEHTGQPSPE